MAHMKIQQIQPGMRNITLIGQVIEKGDIRQVETRFGSALVSWARVEDETGLIRLNLWRSQISQVNTGDTIRLTNAFVRLFNGILELNIGGDGRIEVVKRGRKWS